MGIGFGIQLIEEIVIRITNLSIRIIRKALAAIPGGHIPVIIPRSTFRCISINIIVIHKLGNHVLGGHVIHFISPCHKVISVIFPIRICIHPCDIIIARINPIMPSIAGKILICIAYFISSPIRISDTLIQKLFMGKLGHIHTDAWSNLTKIPINIIELRRSISRSIWALRPGQCIDREAFYIELSHNISTLICNTVLILFLSPFCSLLIILFCFSSYAFIFCQFFRFLGIFLY